MRKRNSGILCIAFFATVISNLSTSCNKNNGQHNSNIDSVILMSNIWYPYMAQIHRTDSGNVFSPNTDTIVTNDTSFYLSQCMQRSTYTFKHNDILEIINECDTPSQQPSLTVWNLTSTRGMELPIIFDAGLGFVTGIGQLNTISQSQFVFDSPLNTSFYGGPGTGYIFTTKDILITFKKK